MKPVEPADKRVKVLNKPGHTASDDVKSATTGDRPPPHCHPTVGDG